MGLLRDHNPLQEKLAQLAGMIKVGGGNLSVERLGAGGGRGTGYRKGGGGLVIGGGEGDWLQEGGSSR